MCTRAISLFSGRRKLALVVGWGGRQLTGEVRAHGCCAPEAAAPGHLFDRQSALLEKFLRTQYPMADEPLVGCGSRGLLEPSRELSHAEVGRLAMALSDMSSSRWPATQSSVPPRLSAGATVAAGAVTTCACPACRCGATTMLRATRLATSAP